VASIQVFDHTRAFAIFAGQGQISLRSLQAGLAVIIRAPTITITASLDLSDVRLLTLDMATVIKAHQDLLPPLLLSPAGPQGVQKP